MGGFHAGRGCPFLAVMPFGGDATSGDAQTLAGMPFWRGCHGLGCHRAVMLIVLPVLFELCSLRMIWTYMRLGIMASKMELPIAYSRHPKMGGFG